jgi:hypothetical protein
MMYLLLSNRLTESDGNYFVTKTPPAIIPTQSFTSSKEDSIIRYNNTVTAQVGIFDGILEGHFHCLLLSGRRFQGRRL